MTEPRDTAAAFDKIAGEVEPLLIRLGRGEPGAELETIRDEITALLDGAGLRWSDVAARVAAPSPSKAASAANVPPPEWDMSAVAPKRPVAPGAFTVMTNEELKAYGYRSRGPGFGS